MLRDLIRRRNPAGEEQRGQITPWGDWGAGYLTASGVTVTPDSALQLLAVYGCVSLIADTIATLPRKCYRQLADGSGEEIKPPRWVEQPNPETTGVEFVTQTLLSLLLDGNAYWAVNADRSFVTNELHCLDPSSVQVRQDAGRVVYYVAGREYRNRLLHLKGIVKPGQLTGLSPVEAARQGVGVGLAAQEFAGGFYRNGTHLSGVLEVPGDLPSDTARDLRDAWVRAHAGAVNASLPAVLTGGAQWKPISVTPEQAQFLQSRGYSAAEISAFMFLVPPSWWGLQFGANGSDITYANIEQRGTHLSQFTLLRWVVRLDKAFSSLLPRPQYHKFNLDGLQRADIKTRYEIGRTGVEAGLILKEEWRAHEELPIDAATMRRLEQQETQGATEGTNDEPQP